MGSKKAIQLLLEAGWKLVRQGKGDHIILEREGKRFIVPGGKTELSPGMCGKVRSKTK